MNGYNFTDRVRKVLQMAREEAARLHHEYVGTEHILLGVLNMSEGVAARVLDERGAQPGQIRDALFRLWLRQTSPTGGSGRSPSAPDDHDHEHSSTPEGSEDPDLALRCSFCRKAQREVETLIQGPEIWICNECIELCNRIILGESSTGIERASEA